MPQSHGEPGRALPTVALSPLEAPGTRARRASWGRCAGPPPVGSAQPSPADERAEYRRGRAPHNPPTGRGRARAAPEPAGGGCPVTAAVEIPARPPVADVVRELLPYEPQSAAAARRLVRIALFGWELEDLVEAAELIVSEFVGNAAKTGCQLRMAVTVERITAGCVRISVRDGSRILPCLIDAGPAAESGRGLALVHHLTGGQWGATAEPFGKTVHADLRARPPGLAPA